MSKHTRWLRAEIDRWTAEGIVTMAQGDRIRALYAEPPAAGLSWGLLVFFGLGAVIIGLGIILLFAYNWAAIPKFGKLALIFAAIASAHGAGLVLRRHADWRGRLAEALSLLGTMAFGAGIWLVAQVYNIDEHYPNGFLLWAAAAIAMAWTLESVPQAMLAAVLVAIWGGTETLQFGRPMDVASLILIVALGPLAWRRQSALLLAVVLAALYWIVLCNAAHWGGSAAAFGNAISLSVLLLALARLAGDWDRTDAERQVLAFFGLGGFAVCAYLLGFHQAARGLLRWSADATDTTLLRLAYRWLVFTLALAAWTWLLLRARRGEGEPVAREEWLFPIGLIYAQGASVFGQRTDADFVAIVFNLVCLALAAAWIVRGCREGRLRPTVLGSVFLAFVVFARYFDLFDSLAARGLAFVLFGAALFAEGFYYRRLRRAETSEGGAP